MPEARGKILEGVVATMLIALPGADGTFRNQFRNRNIGLIDLDQFYHPTP